MAEFNIQIATKKGALKTCKSDSRCPKRLKRNANGYKVFFLRFSVAKYHNEKRERWIRVFHRLQKWPYSRASRPYISNKNRGNVST